MSASALASGNSTLRTRSPSRSTVRIAFEAAAAAFDWPLMKWLALQPVLRFAYFPRRRFFWFRNFADRQERIERGLCAFDLAAAAGWQNVEAALRHYAILPEAFFAGSAKHFASVRESVLAGA